MDIKEKKQEIISAGWKAVDHLIKVVEEAIITGKKDEDLSADKLKNAAATKRLAIEDAFAILNRIEQEQNIIDGNPTKEEETKKRPRRGIAEQIAANK